MSKVQVADDMNCYFQPKHFCSRGAGAMALFETALGSIDEWNQRMCATRISAKLRGMGSLVCGCCP